MSQIAVAAPSFPIRVGEHLALDFTNTAEFRGSAHFVEFLPTFAHWLAWCGVMGLLSATQQANLAAQAQQRPGAAAEALQQVYAVREAIHSLGSAASHGEPLPPPAIATLNDMLRTALPHRRLQDCGAALAWEWLASPDDLAQPLWPLVLAAAELLTSPQVERLGQCPGCGWLFVDTSRSGRRRWCSMDFCGSKAKSRRQYARKRGIRN